MDYYWEQFKTPFLCFAGYSGVGKTTLLEHLIKRFKHENIRVGYYKHDAHRFTMDKEGKDTYRTAQAGAGIVSINDPRHFSIIADNDFKQRSVTHALEQCDCILIEGYKQSPYNKIVFLDSKGNLPIFQDTPGIKAVIHQGTCAGLSLPESEIPRFHRNDVEGIYAFVRAHFISCSSPIYGAVFVGGQSKRMGKPKFSLSYNGKSETERLAVLLGPVGGLATLMGRHPDKAWIIAACDMPFLTDENFEIIFKERDPLRYGTCYMQKGRLGVEPMCAIYEPKFIIPLYEAMSRRELSLSRIINELPFKNVQIHEDDRHHFMNVNNPEEYDLARVKRAGPHPEGM